MVWLPLATVDESQVTCQGAWPAVPTELPSTKNRTLLTDPGLEAAADSVTELPETMEPGAGAETDTVGGMAMLETSKESQFSVSRAGIETWLEAVLESKSPPWLFHTTPPVRSYQVAPSPVQAAGLLAPVPSSQLEVTG